MRGRTPWMRRCLRPMRRRRVAHALDHVQGLAPGEELVQRQILPSAEKCLSMLIYLCTWRGCFFFFFSCIVFSSYFNMLCLCCFFFCYWDHHFVGFYTTRLFHLYPDLPARDGQGHARAQGSESTASVHAPGPETARGSRHAPIPVSAEPERGKRSDRRRDFLLYVPKF